MNERQLYQRLDDLRVSRNSIERTMSGLRPDPEATPGMYREWEDAMGLLSRMHGGITDLMVKAQRGEVIPFGSHPSGFTRV